MTKDFFLLFFLHVLNNIVYNNILYSRMNCDLCSAEIHEGLKDFEESCPFCHEQFKNRQPNEREQCCDNAYIILDRGYSVCKNCGQVAGYKVVNEYVDFRENLYRFRKKSVYNRKYHLENIINDLLAASIICVNYQQRVKIHRIFAEINKILPHINGKRKRIISIKFLLEQILSAMGLEHSPLVRIKSKRTLTSYKEYWNQILDSIGGEIGQ